ncbi:hypothetical protein MRX96_040921 [Rhipicephalus microplus]
MKNAVRTDVAWQRYLQFKRVMQAPVQAKLAGSNALYLQKFKAEGRNAARKFWNYVRTLNWSKQSVQFIVDSNANPTQAMKEDLTGCLKTLYGGRGCTRDLQLDDGDPKCGEERTEQGYRVLQM